MSNKVTVSEETQLDVPPRELMFLEKRDWRRILRMAKAIKGATNYWQNAAWFAVAGSLSCLISGIAQKDSRTVYFSIGGFCLIVGVVLFIGSREFDADVRASKDMLVTEMEDIRQSSVAVDHDTNTSSAGQ